MSQGSKGQWEGEAFNTDHARMGPFELPHPWNTLTAEMSKAVEEETGVKCRTRGRMQWGHGLRLTLFGPPDKLLHAKTIVTELLEQQPDLVFSKAAFDKKKVWKPKSQAPPPPPPPPPSAAACGPQPPAHSHAACVPQPPAHPPHGWIPVCTPHPPPPPAHLLAGPSSSSFGLAAPRTSTPADRGQSRIPSERSDSVELSEIECPRCACPRVPPLAHGGEDTSESSASSSPWSLSSGSIRGCRARSGAEAAPHRVATSAAS